MSLLHVLNIRHRQAMLLGVIIGKETATRFSCYLIIVPICLFYLPFLKCSFFEVFASISQMLIF